MSSVKECRQYNETSGMVYLITAVILFLMASLLTSSAGASPVFLESQTCYGTGNCSLHTLNCQGGARLAILEASYGFQLASVKNDCLDVDTELCSDHCCSYNRSTDCKQKFTANNMDNVQSECSYSSTCRIRAQWGDRAECSGPDMALTSTYSVLKAVCIPETMTVDPCSNITTNGSLVSLYHAHLPTAHNCTCRIDANDTTRTMAGNVQTSAYDIQASSSVSGGWMVKVVDREGVERIAFSGSTVHFPATSITSSVTALPLFASFYFENITSGPQRVWLGFQGDTSSLILRCGQDAVDYTMSLNTVSTTPTGSRKATDNNNNNNNNNKNNNNVPASSTGTGNGSQKASKGDNQTRTGDQGDGDIDTTDIIVYAAVSLSALIVCAFIYVCVRKVYKKGCPSWCPPPCRDMECGKAHEDDLADGGDNGQTNNNCNSDIKGADGNKDNATVNTDDLVKNGVLANGLVVHINGCELPNGAPLAFTQRRCSFEHLKRHRGSMQSLRRASFSNLEDIKETEEDEEENGPRLTPEHHTILNLEANQEDIIKCVDEHIACLEMDDSDGADDVFSQKGASSKDCYGTEISEHPSLAKGQGGKINQGQATDDAPVVFRIGGGSESSDPDLEMYFTKL